MSAVLQSDQARFEAMQESRLAEVLLIEQRAYPHPWTRLNFCDVLRAGYQAQLLCAQDRVLGYFVAMKGVEEVHLLNLTVAPDYQGQGWARVMLDALTLWARHRAHSGFGSKCARATCTRCGSTSAKATVALACARTTTPPPKASAKTRWS